jgi:tRNA(Ile)-lysidine synthase
MGDHLHARGIDGLLTAHTRDDQAETLLMRLARGSGLDGLASIAPSARLGPLRVLRPLLDIPKARLRATLEARDIPWIEDPSNQSPAFERTRLRAAGDALAALGLTGDMLASSARRLQRARAALDGITDSFCAEPEGAVQTDPCGIVRIDRERCAGRPRRSSCACLPGALLQPAGRTSRCRWAKLEPIVDSLCRGNAPDAGSWTLARALIAATPGIIQVEREPGRQPLPRLTLAGGTTALWDGRFAVAVAPGFEGTLEVRALGTECLAELRRLGRADKGTRALHLVPSFWRENTLLAVPTLDFWAVSNPKGLLSANFVGLRYNSGVAAGGKSGDFGAFC